MNSFLKKSVITIAMFAASFASASHACGPEVPEKYLSFFSAQFIGYAPLKESLRVRRFIQEADSLPAGLRDANNNILNPYWANPRDRANLLEWKAYLETNKIAWFSDSPGSYHALSYLIYKFDLTALGNIHQNRNDAQNNPLSEYTRKTFQRLQISQNEYDFLYHTDWLFTSIAKQKDIMEYLQFAKACEVRAFDQSRDDGWGEDEPFDPAAMRELIEEGKARYAACSSEWLKMRYAYQVVRLARYLREFDEAVALYDELAAPLQVESIIRNWALEHATASLCFLGRAAAASPLIAQVFEDAPELRRTAYYCFDQDALASDALAASPHEKAMLWTIAARRRGNRLSFEPLRRVYALAPQSALVESLLVRALLDYEEAEFSRHLEKPDDFALDTAYLAEFEQFVLDASKQQNVRRPALWLLAAGYLRFMRAFADNRYTDAAKLFQQAEDAAENDAQIRHQARLLRHVVKLYQPGRINNTFTASFYPELQWLADQGETVIFQTVMTALGQKFLLQDDVPQAVCCFYAGNNAYWPSGTDLMEMRAPGNLVLDMYADAKDAERLLKFMNQSTFSAFDSFLLRYLPLTQEAVLDVWGTHLLRQHDFTEAAAVFDRIAPNYWERDNHCGESWEGGDFCVKQFETSFFDNAHRVSERFAHTNKVDFIKQVNALEQQARRDRAHAAEYYRQIANAFYNTPYWGYSGVLWNGSLIWSYKYEYGAEFNRYDNEGNLLEEHGVAYPFNMPALKRAMLKREQTFLHAYGTRAIALEYYQKALKAAKDDELAAEALAMSQECVVRPTLASISSGNFLPKNADYFRELHKEYANTAFHQRLLEECPQFAEYVRKSFSEK